MTADPSRLRYARKARLVPSLHGFVGLVLLAGLLTFVAFRLDVDWGGVRRDLAGANLVLYAAAVVAFYLGLWVRALRWRPLLRGSGSREQPPSELPSVLECTRAVVLGRFTDSVMWLRFGSLYRAYHVSGGTGRGFAWGLGTLLAEHFLDLLMVAFVVVMLAAVFLGSDTSATFAYAGGTTIVLAAVAVGGLWAVRRIGPGVGQRLPKSLSTLYQAVHQGTLDGLRKGELRTLAVGSIGIWLCSVARWVLVAQALDVDVNVELLLLVTIVNAVLAGIPVTPGGLGVVEPGTPGVLMLELGAGEAASLVLVERSVSYLSVILVGAALLVTHVYARRNRVGKAQTAGIGQGGP